MATSLIASAAELIERPQSMRPHAVLLGAGASRAAFPHGEANGLRLPVMSDFIELVGLTPLLREAAPELAAENNIEVVYPRLLKRSEWAVAAREVEDRIRAYFTAMALPPEATLYDRLVLSLRSTDAVFTFNWDPFLFDAWERNRGVVPLPSIHFLHGCVRIGMCVSHPDVSGSLVSTCPDCGSGMVPMPLLYPVEKKDYASDPCIARQWNAARVGLADSLTLTVFGYGAPSSDVDAVDLLRSSWFDRSNRQMEHVEIIDKASRDVLVERWSPFSPTLHIQDETRFEDSHIARWPRRVSESWFYPMCEARPCEDFPLPASNDLGELQTFCRRLAGYERA